MSTHLVFTFLNKAISQSGRVALKGAIRNSLQGSTVSTDVSTQYDLDGTQHHLV